MLLLNLWKNTCYKDHSSKRNPILSCSCWSIFILDSNTIQLILRGQSVSSGVVEKFGKANVGVTATSSATQSDATFVSYLKELLPKIGATKSNPAILEADGHISRQTCVLSASTITYINYACSIRSRCQCSVTKTL